MSKEREIVAIFSDWHIHKFKAFSEKDDRLEWSLKVIGDMGQFCEDAGIKKIFFAGDLYHTGQVILTEVVNRVVETLTTFFEQHDIKIYAISGNHDHASKNLIHKPAITGLTHLARIFPDKFILIDNESIEVSEGVILHGIPYYGHKEDYNMKLTELVERISEMPAHLSHQLMIHQTPKSIGSSMIPHDTDPEDPRYKAFDRVWCGHIHTRMDLADNFTLVGNPNHNDLADAGKEKGFLITNLSNPAKGYKFIHLTGYPEFIEVKGDAALEEGVEENNYIVRKPDMDVIKTTQLANVKDFNTNLDSATIMENFWKETTKGTDKELLKVGLSFLQ